MKYSIGVDCESISRFHNEKLDLYINKFLSEKEKEYIKNYSKEKKIKFIASRFSCKEAILKAIGIGIDYIKFNNISIINDELGKPICYLEGYDCEVSISYCGDIVYTSAIIEKEKL